MPLPSGRGGVDVDQAAVALDHDPAGDVEAEAGALADVLGREERLERARDDLRRHARSGVGDLDHDPVALGAGAHREGARAVHRVDGVVDQVGPDLVELAGVGLDRRAGRRTPGRR